MAVSASVVIALKTLFSVFACVMFATLVWATAMDGLASCIDLKEIVITCGYIALQFFKLSPEESSKDPLYFVLMRHQKRDVVRHTRGPTVVTARIIISALGCLMLATFIYMLIVHGSPFHVELFSPCMIAVEIDFYFHVVALSVWVAFKESSWISAFFWILSLVCFGSATVVLPLPSAAYFPCTSQQQ